MTIHESFLFRFTNHENFNYKHKKKNLKLSSRVNKKIQTYGRPLDILIVFIEFFIINFEAVLLTKQGTFIGIILHALSNTHSLNKNIFKSTTSEKNINKTCNN